MPSESWYSRATSETQRRELAAASQSWRSRVGDARPVKNKIFVLLVFFFLNDPRPGIYNAVLRSDRFGTTTHQATPR